MTGSLYRLFDSKHQLLYVGISASAIARLSQHMSDKPWASEIAHVSVEHFETRGEAAEAEVEAIRIERPRYNVAHNRRDIDDVPAQSHIRREVLWVCDECHGPVGNGEGYLHISYHAIHEAEQNRTGWKAKYPGPTIDGSALAQYPKPAQWLVHHDECDPESDQGDYVISIERARTAAQMLSWTAHLMGKNWLPATDWRELLERIKRDLMDPS
jgi:predicted GIY-YIG superfamily endonuclease